VLRSIVFVPAIGADPRATWARHPNDRNNEQRLDMELLYRLNPSAQVHLYDHFTKDERNLKIEAGKCDEEHHRSRKIFAAAEANVAAYGVAEWADRLLLLLQIFRQAQNSTERPVVFICSSTGGQVVKEALTRRSAEKPNDIANACISVTFFATPHHGSSVLSGPEYIKTVQEQLGLKWEMSPRLRRDFILRSPDVESLNYKFAFGVSGINIHSYVESVDTYLDVLSSDDAVTEEITVVRLCVVDSRSGKLSTPEVPIEDEQVIELDTTHVGIPRFKDQDAQYEIYLKQIKSMVSGYSAEDRADYKRLDKHIRTGIKVDIHQFYGEQGSMKILSTHPTLENFLDQGPAKCMQTRINGHDREVQSTKTVSTRPAKGHRGVSEPSKNPVLVVTTVDPDDLSSELRMDWMASHVRSKIAHTRRPSLGADSGHAESPNHPDSPNHLGAKNSKSVQFLESDYLDVDRKRAPQRSAAFKLPGRDLDRFKWIHVPLTHPGWVPQVLTRISQDKQDLNLHKKVLLDSIWISQHNQSRHASPHARFIRPTVKCLLPKGEYHKDGISTPASASNDIQFVTYMPYLHWDSFSNMKKRADVIRRRRAQVQSRPIPKDIAQGKSMVCRQFVHPLD